VEVITRNSLWQPLKNPCGRPVAALRF